jgi:predicted RNA-binding Zn-ribbon protein involved in translation (DUF1610 family)
MKTFVTFGQEHIHRIDGKIFDKDCVAVVNGDRAKVFEIFGPKFCFGYPEEYWDESKLRYFPRGYIYVEKESKSFNLGELTMQIPDQPDDLPNYGRCNSCGWIGPLSKCKTEVEQESWEIPTLQTTYFCPNCDNGEIDDFFFSEELHKGKI